MSTPENPPAFPYVEPPTTCNVNEGISTRDYFAAHALPVAYSQHEAGYFDSEEEDLNGDLAKAAYQLADAMLAARKEPQ